MTDTMHRRAVVLGLATSSVAISVATPSFAQTQSNVAPTFYNPTIHRQTDVVSLLDEIDAIGFATLVSMGKNEPFVSQVPLLLDRSAGPKGTLFGHLSRANAQGRDSDFSKPVVVLFSGPQAYVSPSFYPSKAEHGKVTPTWNYSLVHVRGRLTVFEDPKALLAQVSALTDRRERGRAVPWKVADAPADYTDSILKAIVGVRIEIEAIEGKGKLSQNRNEADRAGVIKGLAASPDPMDKITAERMRQLGK